MVESQLYPIDHSPSKDYCSLDRYLYQLPSWQHCQAN